MLENQQLAFFAGYIEKELGIVYAEHNYYQLKNRLQEISTTLADGTLDGIFAKAQEGIRGAFRQMLLDIATNNETSFFRDPTVFQSVLKQMIEAGLGHASGRPLRIWSAASSSGQEALSLALSLEESPECQKGLIHYQITGTDISERILEKARKAVYSDFEVQRGLSDALRAKYFEADKPGFWRAKASITQRISYQNLNLNDEYRFREKFDLVLCRNVLIYQNVDRKIQILKKVHDVIAPEGVLVLGSGESLIGLSSDFNSVNHAGAVVYRKKISAQKAA